VVNPLAVKRYGQLVGATAKTDKQDATRLVRYARPQELKACVHRSKEAQQLSQKLLVIAKLQKQTQLLQNHTTD